MLQKAQYKPVTVSQLNLYIKDKIANDDALRMVCVEGEISNITFHSSGHIYFTLKDNAAAIRAVMFRGYRQALKFMPANGMKILCIGEVNVYDKTGTVQIYCTNMLQSGVGQIYEEFELLKKKLSDEGLFSEAHKKPIPKFPKTICLVTSPTGAALQDMKNVLGRRYPLTRLYLYPTQVQGDVSSNIREALVNADTMGFDVIILARGGGSIEDLYVFNDEKLARTIYALNTPIITGIGHEIDFTIADFVSDLRAPTPSAAAEVAVPNRDDLLMELISSENRLRTNIENRLSSSRKYLDNAVTRLEANTKGDFIKSKSELELIRLRMEKSIEKKITLDRQTLELMIARLNGNNPLGLCSKGYVKVTSNDRTVTSTDDVAVGDTLKIYMADGQLEAKITDKEKR